MFSPFFYALQAEGPWFPARLQSAAEQAGNPSVPTRKGVKLKQFNPFFYALKSRGSLVPNLKSCVNPPVQGRRAGNPSAPTS
jgi:hypothetical protein